MAWRTIIKNIWSGCMAYKNKAGIISGLVSPLTLKLTYLKPNRNP